MRRRYVIFCFIFCAVFLLGYLSKAAADKIFGNMTYLTDCPYIAEKVSLVNGQGILWNHRLHVSLYYEGQYVYGDFNRDGLKDAAVIIGESEGGSSDFQSLAFLIHNGTQLVHEKSAYLGNAVIVNALKERDGKVVMDMFVHQEGDCMAGPTKRVKNVYEYAGPDIWIDKVQKS